MLVLYQNCFNVGKTVVHSSTGETAKIKPWPNGGNITQSDQPYLRFGTDNDQWSDGENVGSGFYHTTAICESYSSKCKNESF